MSGIYNIISESSRIRYGGHTETHDIIIRRILHVRAIYADWEEDDWVFKILMDSEKFTFHIRTPILAFGSEWTNLVANKYDSIKNLAADRDEELAKNLKSYEAACQKRTLLLDAISAFYTKRKALEVSA